MDEKLFKVTQQAIQRHFFKGEQLFLAGFALTKGGEKSLWVPMSAQQSLLYIPTGAGGATRWPSYHHVDEVFERNMGKILVEVDGQGLWLHSIDKLSLDNLR